MWAMAQAQTPQQRRANLKFAKDQEARRGKSEDQLKKKAKDAPKSPISPMWLGKNSALFRTALCSAANTHLSSALLGFVVFGGLLVEVFSRFFLR